MPKKFIITFCLWLIYGLIQAQIGAKTQQADPWLGTWINQSLGYQMVLTLSPNGTGNFDDEPFTYKVQQSKLYFTQDGETTIYSISISGQNLTLSGGDLDAPLTFLKSSKTPTSEKSTENKLSNEPSTIVGSWIAEGEVIEFTSDGKCSYMGQVFPYQLTGSQLVIQTALGNAIFDARISENQLSLSAAGETIVYSRTGSSQTVTPSGESQGTVSAELVGKWCYTNVTRTNSGGSTSERCITLHANGTYEYYGERSMSVNTEGYYGGTNSSSTDRGTWTTDGQRIYYTSSSGNGSGSYRLEKRNHPKNNDPMIVLDGETYVTYYQKSPWR